MAICMKLLFLALLAAASLAWLPVPSVAQDEAKEAQPAATAEPKFPFRQLPVVEDMRRRRIDVERMLRSPGGQLSAEDEALLKSYLYGYELSRFTQADEINSIPELRDELNEKFQMAARNPDIMEKMNLLVGGFMRNVAVSNQFHPASRVNAVLVIGDLDDPRAPRGQSQPWIPALTPLMQIVKDPATPDSLRVAAMIGIRRHAQLDGRAEASTLGVAEPMRALARQKEAPAGRSGEGHIWMRRLAMEVIAELGHPGPELAILRELIAIANDDEEPLEVRSAAIEATAAMPLADLQVDYRKLAAMMGLVAIDAVRKDVAVDPSSESYSPQRLLARLASLKVGFLAISGKGTGPQRQTVNRIDQYVAAMGRIAGDEAKPREEQRRELLRLADGLEGFLNGEGLGKSSPSDDSPAGESPAEPEEELPF